LQVSAEKVLMKGNEAVCQGAIDGGCTHFFGYPITPQNEIPEYMSVHARAAGRVFLQAESEIAAINMVFGASAAGARPMTSSSGPGIALKQEGLSYLIGAELPCLVVNMARGGPGLGNIAPSQQDYFLATRGGGHGDGRPLVYAPAGVQELYDIARNAFVVAERYRNPVMILGDGILGQMMEPLEVRGPLADPPPEKSWAVTGAKNRPRRVVNSLHIVPAENEEFCLHLAEKYAEAARRETAWDEYGVDEPELVIVAYGTVARICRSAVSKATREGIKARLLRPVTVFPFPSSRLRELAEQAKLVLVVEMSLGQLVDDVRIAVGGCAPVELYARTGGVTPSPEEVFQHIASLQGSRWLSPCSGTLSRQGVADR
jgi:2-oxoglutarate ferredoxin oxidoreductase subunit alpha